MADDQRIKPANILNIVAINQGRRPLTRERPEAEPLAAERVHELMASGHYLVDTRSPAGFARGHVPGSVNVQASSSEFEQRVGWVVPDDHPIILLCESHDAAQECMFKLAFIGLDASVAGFLEGGMSAWTEAGLPVSSAPQIGVAALRERLRENGMRVLDVRERDEWDDGNIEGSVQMPYTHLAPQLGAPPRFGELGLEKDEPVAVVCASGNRSSTAISLMLREGYTDLHNVIGGMTAWRIAKLPTVDGAGRPCAI